MGKDGAHNCVVCWGYEEMGEGVSMSKGRVKMDRVRRQLWRNFKGSNTGEGSCHLLSFLLGRLWDRKGKNSIFLCDMKLLVTTEFRNTFLLWSGKGYTQEVILKNVDYLLKNIRISVQYVSHIFIKYKIYIRIQSPFLVIYYNIMYEQFHSWEEQYSNPQ